MPFDMESLMKDPNFVLGLNILGGSKGSYGGFGQQLGTGFKTAQSQLQTQEKTAQQKLMNNLQMQQAKAKAAKQVREEAAAAEQRARQDELIATLPENQRALASAYPSAYGKQMVDNSFAKPRQTDDQLEYQQAVGQGFKGSIMDFVQAQQPSKLYTPAEFDQRIKLAGEEARILAKAKSDAAATERDRGKLADKANRRQILQGKSQATGRLQDQINRAKELNTVLSTGFVGQQTQNIGGTPANDLAKTLDTVKANVGFDKLMEMKSQSKTGGALGSVSERELNLLTGVLGSLDLSQRGDQLNYNLDQVENAVRESWNRVYDAYMQDYGERHPDDVRKPPPEPGTVVNGYVFVGGDPKSKHSWRQTK